MAQKHLAQDLTTSKVNSLPKELRDIAESLIGDKFGYEEVKESQYSASFQRTIDPREFFVDTRTGHIRFEATPSGHNLFSDVPAHLTTNRMAIIGGGEVIERIHAPTGRHYVSTSIESPNTRSFRDAIQRLDMVNARTNDRFAYLPKKFARALFSTPDFQYCVYTKRSEGMVYERSKGDYIGQLFGVKVFVSRDRRFPEIETYR